MNYYFRLQKTYTNGTTHTVFAGPDQATEYRTEVDKEDVAAGLVGVWDEEVRYFPHED